MSMGGLGHSGLVRFADFCFDLRNGVIYKHGVRLRLEEQPRRVLTLLLEQHGEVVTRRDLQRRIWPEDIHVDYVHGIDKAVHKLRSLLRHSHDAHGRESFIETLRGRGYRFVAPIYSDGVQVYAGPERRYKVAILPFAAALEVPREHADAIADQIACRLVRLNAKLRILAQEAATRHKLSDLSVKEMSTQAGIDFIIAGAMRQVTGRLCLTIELINTADETCLWVHTFSIAERSTPALVRKIIERIVEQLGLRQDSPG